MPLNPASAEQLRFCSDAIPEPDRFERYKSLYAHGSDAVLLGPAFRADVTGWRLDRAVLFDRSLHDVGHGRDADRVARDGFDHWTLTMLMSGTLEVNAGWGFRAIAPGELVLLDTAKTMANRLHGARILTLSLARERITAAASNVKALHGVVVPAEQAGLIGDYLLALSTRLAHVPADCIPAVTQPIHTLLAVALAAGGDALLLPGHADRVRQLIEARLGDPAFNAASAVADSGLSRATLYRLFQSFGGLAVYIQRRRLNRVRAALADAADERSFADIAHGAGFGSESHCSRLFQEAYGARPGEFRAANIPAGTAPVGRMEHLVDEVR